MYIYDLFNILGTFILIYKIIYRITNYFIDHSKKNE